MSLLTDITAGFQKLYPSGRAWKFVTGISKGGFIPFVDGEENDFVDGADGVFGYNVGLEGENASIYTAKIDGMHEMYQEIYSILDQRYPDNDNFTEEDASNWERIYGLISTGLTLEERKNYLGFKIAYPNGKLERLHYLFIQSQLRAAGFDVYVHENRFPVDYVETQVGFAQVGITNVGSNVLPSEPFTNEVPVGYTEICANYIDSTIDDEVIASVEGTSCGYAECGTDTLSVDNIFDDQLFARGSFFIGGEEHPNYADVPIERRDEFRQLILSIKPIQIIAVLNINYTS